MTKTLSPLEEKLLSELSPVVAGEQLFLEKVRFKKSGRFSTLEVIVDLEDGPGQVDSEQLAQVTRAISKWLDEHDPINGQYTLEVSTPGIDRALQEPRQYRRAEGKKIRVQLVDGTENVGKLAKVEAECVQLEMETGVESIDFSQIKTARMVVEF